MILKLNPTFCLSSWDQIFPNPQSLQYYQLDMQKWTYLGVLRLWRWREQQLYWVTHIKCKIIGPTTLIQTATAQCTGLAHISNHTQVVVLALVNILRPFFLLKSTCGLRNFHSTNPTTVAGIHISCVFHSMCLADYPTLNSNFSGYMLLWGQPMVSLERYCSDLSSHTNHCSKSTMGAEQILMSPGKHSNSHSASVFK